MPARTKLFATLIAALTLGLSACGISRDPGTGLLADLEVHWTLEGSSAPSLCAAYGIDRWSVLLTGPQRFEVVTDCVIEHWDTGGALYAIPEGRYAIDIAALDFTGFDLGGVRSDITLFDQGFVDVVEIPLYPSDLPP